jgi:hypothetical protein
VTFMKFIRPEPLLAEAMLVSSAVVGGVLNAEEMPLGRERKKGILCCHAPSRYPSRRCFRRSRTLSALLEMRLAVG